MQRTHRVVGKEMLTYLLAVLAIIYLNLLPLRTGSAFSASPDLIYCLTIGWVMRRPDSAPVILVALAGLTADILLGRPLGLWALLMVLASEFFRNRETGKGLQMRLLEWFSVAASFLVILLAYKAVLTIGFSTAPTFTALAWHLLLTVVAYPPSVAVLYWGLKIRAPLAVDRSRSIGRVT